LISIEGQGMLAPTDNYPYPRKFLLFITHFFCGV
jgi:hypothetical protein